MKGFVLGVVTTLLALVVAVTALVVVVGDGAEPGGPLPSPPPSGVRVPPPTDLADDETWLGAFDLTSREVISAQGDLVDVRATGTGVRLGPDGLRATTLAIRATAPFATVARRVGGGVRLYAAGGGLAGVERTETVLGREVLVRATGRVTVRDGRLVLEPETVDVGAPGPVTDLLSAAARELVSFTVDVPGVPQGMTLREVAVTGAGFDVRLDGRDVVITR